MAKALPVFALIDLQIEQLRVPAGSLLGEASGPYPLAKDIAVNPEWAAKGVEPGQLQARIMAGSLGFERPGKAADKSPA